jgi:nitrate reductase NapAB chaperone NapD
MILDRRRFLTGDRLASRASKAQDAESVLCAIIIQLNPDRLDAVLTALSAHEGVTVADRSARGRVTLALSGRASADVACTLAAVSDLPGVVSAMLAPPSRTQADEVSV